MAKRILTGAIAALGVAGAVALTAGSPAAAQGGSGCYGDLNSDFYLNVEATNVSSSRGKVVFTAYPDQRSRFLRKNGEVVVGRIPARAGTTRGCIKLPKAGVYAIAVYHDEDGDGFDRSGLGLPAEGYGFSNNPSTLAGLPSFGSVRLRVSKPGLTTRVTLKYP